MKSLNEIIEQVKGLHHDLLEIKDEKAEKENQGLEELLKKIGKKYAVVKGMFFKHPLIDETEHRKKVYMRLLASLALSGKDILQDKQYAFVNRVCKSISYKDETIDLFREVVNNTETVFAEFCQEFNTKEILSLWCIDGSIIVGLAIDNKQMKFLAEIESSFGLSKTEIQFITIFAKAVLAQDQAVYEQALKFDCPVAWKGLLEQYILELGESFVDGVVKDNNEICSYKGAKEEYTKITLKDKYTCRTLSFQHVEFSFEKMAKFKCENIEIVDCKITGSMNGFKLNEIIQLYINQTEFKDFKNGVFDIESVKKIVLTNNTFENCTKNVECEFIPAGQDNFDEIKNILDKGEEKDYWIFGESYDFNGMPILKNANSGAVLQVKNAEKTENINICNNKFDKCNANVPRGVVITFCGALELKNNVKIVDNSFNNCACMQDKGELAIKSAGKTDGVFWENVYSEQADKKRKVALFYYDNGCVKKLLCESLVYLGEEHCCKESCSNPNPIFESTITHIEINKLVVALEKENKIVDSNLTIFGNTRDTFSVNSLGTVKRENIDWETLKK